MNARSKFPTPPMTVDDFFAWDGGGHAGKLELVEGVVRAMAPASANHSFIQGNIFYAIKHHLRGTGSRCCVGVEAPVIPFLHADKNARVPDIAVTCEPPSESKFFESPISIVEVLSPTNENETWESAGAIAGLISVKEILIVQSMRVEAEIYTRRDDGAWPVHPVIVSAGGTILLASLGLRFPLNAAYEGTLLEPT